LRPKLRLLGAGRLAQQRVACRGALGRENDSPVTQQCRSQLTTNILVTTLTIRLHS
jgi:hypothetical protein